MRTVQEIEKKVFSFIEEHHMLKAGDRVIAGVSGGADSVCLLLVLLQYRKTVPIKISVVHMDHKIRKESGEDASYVRRLCEEADIPFYLYERDINDIAVRNKCSTEEAGRMARYEAFYEVADQLEKNENTEVETTSERRTSERTTSEKITSEKGSTNTASDIKIAIAHNKNDTCETMLFNLFRGSGLKGLCGISPVRDRIIRPLLCLQRSEIETYLNTKGISFCKDATNEEDDYTRNRIRHHILPFAEEEICKGAVDHIAEAGKKLSQLDDYLMGQTKEAAAKCVKSTSDGETLVDCERFLALHPVIRGRLLLELLKEISGVGKDISSVHIEALLGLFEGETGKMLSLPYGICARRNYGEVLFSQSVGKTQEADIEFLPKENESFSFSVNNDVTCNCRVFPYEKTMEVSQNKYTKWFDYDKIKSTLTFRKRNNGDFLSIKSKNGSVGHKKLKDYLINEKVSRQERESLLVLAQGSDILWVVGYRIGEAYKITEQTKMVLQIELISDKGYEE